MSAHGTVVNWFSEKLEFRVRERPSAAPIPDPIEPVLTLRANMRGVDGLSPSVGDSGYHAFNRIGCRRARWREALQDVAIRPLDEPMKRASGWNVPFTVQTRPISNPVAIRGLQSKHEAVCCFEEGFGAEMASIAQATDVIPERAEPCPRLGCTACPRNTNPLADVDPGRLTRDQRPTPPMPTTYLEAVSPSPSAPPSPDLSSFPSQSWSIIANVDIEQILTICGDEDLFGMDYVQNLSVPTTPTDSCGPPTLCSSSPTQSPSLTVAEASDEDLSGTNVDIEQISTPVMICGDEDLSGMDYAQRSIAEASDEDLSGISVDIEQISTPVTICGDEDSRMDYAQRSGVPTTPTDSCGTPTLGSSSPTQSPSLVVAEASDEDLSGTNDISGMDYAQNSSVPTTPTDSCGPPALGSSSHPQSSSLTIVEPSPGSANATAESDDASGMGIQTKGSSNDTLHKQIFRRSPPQGTPPRRQSPPSLSMERYAPSKRIRVQKLRLTPSGTLRKKQALVPRTVSTKQASLLSPMLSVFRKAARRRLLSGPETPRPKLSKVVQRRQEGKLNQSTPVTDPDGMSPSGSPPLSPDLSSLPSQSRRVITDAEVEQTVMPSTGCGDQNLPSTATTPRSGDSSVLTDSCGSSAIGSSPPAQSSPPTVIAPSPSSANTTAGSDGTSKISSPTKQDMGRGFGYNYLFNGHARKLHGPPGVIVHWHFRE
ncbi:hypothetical protein L210DRAFT_3628227 [Boletus edulis BED1]|uniref:Uncharacterized protein n=1 Tax=Boletus edulis BED1 TaxID=1328754 RepID=A0AAD4GJP6_BOLED|nr:hypothetical protein L210DRAFT_3628227 [Boletus edulis BED1]